MVIRVPTSADSAAATQPGGAFLRYVLVGVFNTLLDLGLFTLFAVVVGLHPLVANILSTSITLCVSYLLNRVFVFRTDRSVQGTVVQFVAVTLISGLLIQSAVIWVVLRIGAVVVPDLSPTSSSRSPRSVRWASAWCRTTSAIAGCSDRASPAG